MTPERYLLRSLFAMLAIALFVLPGTPAADPLWTTESSTNGELSTVVISQDGSTIVAGGDQLIALSHDGRRLWTGWSGSRVAISRDGSLILTTRDQNVRLISGAGTMLWDQRLDVPVNEIAMTPDGSLILAGGANMIRLMTPNGSGIRQNRTMPLMNHFRFFPSGNGIVVTSKNGIQTSNLTFFNNWSDTNMSQEYVETSAGDVSFVSVTNNRVRYYSLDGTLSGNLAWEKAIPGGNALGFAYSRDGSTIVIGRDDNTLEVLDRNGNTLFSDKATYWITSVAVSDDGNTIVAGSMDKTVAVYDRSGKKLGTATLKNPVRSSSVAVSGDGSVIAAVDGTAVYGFSRAQFLQPEAPAVTTTGPAVTAATIPPATAATTAAPAVPEATTTPKAPAGPAAALAGLAILALLRGRGE